MVKLHNPGKGASPSPHLGVEAIENEAFWSLSTTVANLTFYYDCHCVPNTMAESF